MKVNLTMHVTQEDCQQQEKYPVTSCLSVKPEEAGLPTIPPELVKHVFNKDKHCFPRKILLFPPQEAKVYLWKATCLNGPHYIMTEKKQGK